LRRDIEGHGPEVDLPVGVDAGDDEEDAGTLGSALAQSTQSKDDGTFVFLDNLKWKPNIKVIRTPKKNVIIWLI
jgi:hypothetical protein